MPRDDHFAFAVSALHVLDSERFARFFGDVGLNFGKWAANGLFAVRKRHFEVILVVAADHRCVLEYAFACLLNEFTGSVERNVTIDNAESVRSNSKEIVSV